MNRNIQSPLQQLIPYILLGIAIALGVALFIMFSYVVLWGLVIGGILWLVSLAKQYLFSKQSKDNKKGRIIEHDDKY